MGSRFFTHGSRTYSNEAHFFEQTNLGGSAMKAFGFFFPVFLVLGTLPNLAQ
jgi:hypothetical protein